VSEISTPSATGVAERLGEIRNRVDAACRAAGRDPSEVSLIAVSKTQDVSAMIAACAAGQRHFGENRVQEAQLKWPDVRGLAAEMTLHLIGPLQTNKASEVVGLFDVIHTLDRPRLAEKLSAEMNIQGRRLSCFVQVNTGREEQKAGVDPKDANAFIAACRSDWNLPVVGLMCIPPVNEQAAIHFAFLREIAKRNGLSQLSMGMSDDFETAIAFGATHIRVGSAIFGARR